MIESINWNTKSNYLCFLVCIFFGSFNAAWSHESAPLPSGIAVSVKVDRQSLSVDDEIWAEVTYSNVSNREIGLLKRDTALGGGMTEDLFAIEFEGRELRYTGAHVKRLAPIDTDYVYLKPGQSASEKIDLLRSYPIDYKGEYFVRLRNYGVSPEGEVNAKTDNTLSIELASDRTIRLLKRTPAFQNCSASQRTVIDDALTSAERIANVANNALGATPVSSRPNAARYNEWFGSYTAGRYAQVQLGMSRIANALSNQVIGFDCDCSNQPGVDPNRTFAFVFKNDPFNMTLCGVFFQVPRDGTDSKSGTIVHEVSHFTIVADSDDFQSALDQRGSRNLARNSPASAIRNANAFEYFAENTPFLEMPAPDLALSNANINPTRPNIAGSTSISATVSNVGVGASPATSVIVKLIGQQGETELARKSVSALSQGGSSELLVEFEAPAEAGLYTFEVCLDISDVTLANNCSTLNDVMVVDGIVIAPIIPLLLDD